MILSIQLTKATSYSVITPRNQLAFEEFPPEIAHRSMYKAKNFNRQCDPTLSVLQPIADRVAKNLEITSKNFQFSTRCTRILIGFVTSTIHYVVPIVNPMGRILVR